MPLRVDGAFDGPGLLTQFRNHNIDFGNIPGFLFQELVIYFDKPSTPPHSNGIPENTSLEQELLGQTVQFAGGTISQDVHDETVTHIIIGDDTSRVKDIRGILSRRRRVPRIVNEEWIRESWKAQTLIDEERFTVF
jgi:DNA ligase-4